MHIRFTEHPNLQEYHNDDHMPSDYRITNISDEGVANVKQDVGENLIEAFDHVVEHEGGA